MILFWNVRGLNCITKQKRLYEKIKSTKVSIVCLLETHVLQENQKKVVDRIFPNCSLVDNYSQARLGRICVLYTSDIRIHMHSCSSQALHFHVFLVQEKKYFFLSVIY